MSYKILFLFLLLPISCSQDDKYAIYRSSENGQIDLIFNRNTGKYWIDSKRNFLFSIKEPPKSDGEDAYPYNLRAYKKDGFFELSDINVYVPFNFDKNKWGDNNISCVSNVIDNNSFRVICKLKNSTNKYDFSLDKGLKSFTAKCLFKEDLCQFKLQSKFGIFRNNNIPVDMIE